MPVEIERTRMITPTGIGRKDYTRNIEVSVMQAVRPKQIRFFYNLHFGAGAYPPIVPLPLVWEEVFPFWETVTPPYRYTNIAPARPHIFYLLSETLNRNCLIALSLNRYNSWSDYLAGLVAEQYGAVYGYEEALLKYTKGIPSIRGNVYTITLAYYTRLAVEIELTIHGFIGALETLE